ncbi:hypothetical protein [Kitasatospora sp. NPDC047058]|uniref:WXG100 family type VII secretion target n=1 Tax=Kitasatospora sp. NPDC047058 TaxID=3155620 RepID=UPI0033E60269
MEDRFGTKVHGPGEAGEPAPAMGLVTEMKAAAPPAPTPAASAPPPGEPGLATATAAVAVPAKGAAAPAAPAKDAGTGFEAHPAQYRAAVSPMLSASDRVSSAYLALDSVLTSMNATNPWGNDHAGHQFAEGEKGYLAYSAGTLKGLKGLPAALRRVAEGLQRMADNYEHTERNLVNTFKGRDGDAGPAAGPADPLPAAAAVPQAPGPVAPTLPAPHVGPMAHTGGRR